MDSFNYNLNSILNFKHNYMLCLYALESALSELEAPLLMDQVATPSCMLLIVKVSWPTPPNRNNLVKTESLSSLSINIAVYSFPELKRYNVKFPFLSKVLFTVK